MNNNQIPTIAELEKLHMTLKADVERLNRYGRSLIEDGKYPYTDTMYMAMYHDFNHRNEYRLKWLQYYVNGGNLPKFTMSVQEAYKYDTFLTIDEVRESGKCDCNCSECEFNFLNDSIYEENFKYCRKFYRHEDQEGVE